MKHHFGDLLDRTDDYWTIVPNIERYAYIADKEITDKELVKVLTIGKEQKHWEQVFECPNLEELTLHAPSTEQLQALKDLPQNLKRIRITFLRTKDIEFISELKSLEEVIFEYVSGFSDLSPLRQLIRLKSLHLENLRRVSNFEGLEGINSLRYLHIDGTVDWSQPIDNFNFLQGLQNLEVLSLRFVINRTAFPAFLPILSLKKLRKIKIGRATFSTKEYAFLQAALPNVEGCNWDLFWDYNDNYEFLGKGAGRIGKKNPNAKVRCDEFERMFSDLKKESEEIIKRKKI